MIGYSPVTTRYIVKTARGYFRGDAAQRPPAPGSSSDWTKFSEEAHGWVDPDACQRACRAYTQATGESAVVVVTIRPVATSDRAPITNEPTPLRP